MMWYECQGMIFAVKMKVHVIDKSTTCRKASRPAILRCTHCDCDRGLH